MVIVGTFTIQVSIAEARYRVIFEFVRRLSAAVLLWTPFLDKLIRSLFPKERTVVPLKSTTVPI